jgi:hypothetical protein
MNEKLFTQEQIDTIKQIVKDHPDVIICGSAALVLQGLLKRPIHDIDVVSKKDYYSYGGFYNNLRANGPSESHEFLNENFTVRCFKVKFENGVNVDVFHSERPIHSTEIDTFGITFSIEFAKSAINAKIGYVKRTNSEYIFFKNYVDLLKMNAITMQEAADLIMNSDLYKTYQGKFIPDLKDKNGSNIDW